MQQSSPTNEPPRIRKLRRALANAIPRVPNNKESLLHMQQKRLPDLVIDYVNWRSRYVGMRRRTATMEPSARLDPRWAANSAAIDAFLEKVRQGDDLTPHLSIGPKTRGYAVAAHAQSASSDDKWSDKDFILNTTGYHHFHLGTQIELKGHANRTGDLIFAHVTRDQFKLIAIFDHTVFDFRSAERMRLCAFHDAILTHGLQPGAVYVGGMIALSGHTIQTVRYAQDCVRVMADFEPKLDNTSFVRDLYKPREEAPAKPKPEWTFVHLDLAIYDKAKPALLIFQKGWN